jgi:hypothetical protein
LFYGQARQRIAEATPVTEERTEQELTQHVAFNSVYISVRDEASSDLYERLMELYFGNDEVEINGKIQHKVLELEKVPPILQIQLEAGL